MLQVHKLVRSSALVFSVGLLTVNTQAWFHLSSVDPHADAKAYIFDPAGFPGPFSSDSFALHFPNSPGFQLDQHGGMDIKLQAPAGYKFVVTWPTENSPLSANLTFSVQYDPQYSLTPAVLKDTFVTFDMQGTTPTGWSPGGVVAHLPTTAAEGVYTYGVANVTSSFSFTSMTFGFDYTDNSIPAGVSLGTFKAGSLIYHVDFSGGDGAGPLLTLEQIPEPASVGVLTAALLGGVAGGRTFRRRREGGE